MCQLREALTPKKLLQFYSKSGSSLLKQRQQCLVWFDIKVFYIKIVDACGFDCAPASLTLHYAPRSSSTLLEVNGTGIRPSASAFVTLKRSEIDGDLSVATYASTVSVRTTGKLCFDVFVSDETLVCGVLERQRRDSVEYDADGQVRQVTWNVECSCALDHPSKWSSTKKGISSFPSMEVYIAGEVGNVALALTCTEQLIPRRRRVHHGITLDAIPEGNDYENSLYSDFDGSDIQGGKLDDRSIANMCEAATQRLSKLFEPKKNECLRHSQLSWVNAGLRLSVGVGLGMCFGFCVGMSLLVGRAYEATTKPLKRR